MPASSKPRKKRNPNRSLTLNKARKGAKIFAPIRHVMRQLANGEIDAIDDIPVFLDWEGRWREVVPTLRFWVGFWQRVATKNALTIDFSPVEKLVSELSSNTQMEPETVAGANATLLACERAFRTTPLHELSEMLQTEDIASLASQIHVDHELAEDNIQQAA